MLKLTKTQIFPNCQVPNGFFVNLIIQKFKFWKSDQLFIVSVSLVRGFFEGMRQNILYIFWAKVVYWKMNLTYLLANSWTRLVFFIPCITLYRLEKKMRIILLVRGHLITTYVDKKSGWFGGGSIIKKCLCFEVAKLDHCLAS